MQGWVEVGANSMLRIPNPIRKDEFSYDILKVFSQIRKKIPKRLQGKN